MLLFLALEQGCRYCERRFWELRGRDLRSGSNLVCEGEYEILQPSNDRCQPNDSEQSLAVL